MARSWPIASASTSRGMREESGTPTPDSCSCGMRLTPVRDARSDTTPYTCTFVTSVDMEATAIQPGLPDWLRMPTEAKAGKGKRVRRKEILGWTGRCDRRHVSSFRDLHDEG